MSAETSKDQPEQPGTAVEHERGALVAVLVMVVLGVARNPIEDEPCNRLDRVNERLTHEHRDVVGHHGRVAIPDPEVLG